MALIQWNANGFYSHLPELQNLLTQTKATYICIQETRCREDQTAKLRGYTTFQKNRNTHLNASGGIAILVNNNSYAEEIPLQTDLEAVAILTYTSQRITICNIYLPPNQPIIITQLQDIIQ